MGLITIPNSLAVNHGRMSLMDYFSVTLERSDLLNMCHLHPKVFKQLEGKTK